MRHLWPGQMEALIVIFSDGVLMITLSYVVVLIICKGTPYAWNPTFLLPLLVLFV